MEVVLSGYLKRKGIFDIQLYINSLIHKASSVFVVKIVRDNTLWERNLVADQRYVGRWDEKCDWIIC